MKNKFVFIIAVSTLLISVLSCRFYNPLQDSSNSSTGANSESSNSEDKSLAEKAIDTSVGEEKIGVPECDELLNFFADQSKSDDESYITKAFREYYLNTIREELKKSIEENKNDPKKMGKECKKLKIQLDKFKAEEDNKKNKP